MANLNLIGTTPAVKWCGGPNTAIGTKMAVGTGFWLLALLISEDGNRAIGTVTMHNRKLRIDDAAGHTHPDFCSKFGITASEKVCSAAVEYSEDNLKKVFGILAGKKVYSLSTPYLLGKDGKNPMDKVQFFGGKLVDVIKTAYAEPLPERKTKKAGTPRTATKKLDDMSQDELKVQQKLIQEKIKAASGSGDPNKDKGKDKTKVATSSRIDPVAGKTVIA